MQMQREKRGDKLFVKSKGRIDTMTAPEWGMAISDELDDITELVLDFAGIDYVSSLGLRVVLELQKKMNEQQGSMKLLNVQKDVMEVFEMTGFVSILTIENA